MVSQHEQQLLQDTMTITFHNQCILDKFILKVLLFMSVQTSLDNQKEELSTDRVLLYFCHLNRMNTCVKQYFPRHVPVTFIVKSSPLRTCLMIVSLWAGMFWSCRPGPLPVSQSDTRWRGAVEYRPSEGPGPGQTLTTARSSLCPSSMSRRQWSSMSGHISVGLK